MPTGVLVGTCKAFAKLPLSLGNEGAINCRESVGEEIAISTSMPEPMSAIGHVSFRGHGVSREENRWDYNSLADDSCSIGGRGAFENTHTAALDRPEQLTRSVWHTSCFARFGPPRLGLVRSSCRILPV